MDIDVFKAGMKSYLDDIGDAPILIVPLMLITMPICIFVGILVQISEWIEKG
jgi:hypothetical protein